jgi:Fur family ferric uptake transcriptional regulator
MVSKKNNFQFEKLLEKHNLKKTPARLRVLSLLASKNVATSQPDLESVMLDVDRVTLYRILSAFEEKGIIHKIFNLEGTANYALCSDCEEHHHRDEHVHFNCINCKNVFCLNDLDLPALNLPEGFQIENFTLYATGLCSRCSKKQNKDVLPLAR